MIYIYGVEKMTNVLRHKRTEEHFKILCTTHAHILLFNMNSGEIDVYDVGEMKLKFDVVIPKSF